VPEWRGAVANGMPQNPSRQILRLDDAAGDCDHRKTMRKLLVVVAAVALGLLVAAPASGLPRPSQLRREARALVAAGVPGVIVLSRDGSRTVRVAAGSADLTPRTPMRAGDRFRVGSITKTFVAALTLQLVADGRMSLDDTVERWVPGLVPGGAGVTVRQLLNHTSGLFDYLNDGDDTIITPYLQGDVTHVTPPRQIVQVATSHPPHFPPGTMQRYSNTGYIVLGLVIEAVTGDSLSSQLRQRIFQPLGLRGTTFDATESRIAGRHAHAYFATRPGGPLQEIDLLSSSVAWSAGALVSTAGDLARFYRALLQGRLLRPDLLREMETTVPIGVPDEGYGLGLWHTRSLDLGPRFRLPCTKAVWGHNGGIAGWTSNAFNSRNARRQMVVLLNTDALSSRGRRALGRIFSTAFCG
jgi:D-alanyl-D-alanine carboxypeptidase